MNKRQKLIFKIMTLIFLIASVLIIVSFTGKTGEESNELSRWVAKKIENFVGSHFTIRREDVFWRSTLNAILRKLGHFLEFAFLGLTMGAFFILILRKKWVSALLSSGLCCLMALLDEYRQIFISGRTPQWFDVKLDIMGSLFGILLVFTVWSIYSRLMIYKKRVNEMEQIIKNHHLEE